MKLRKTRKEKISFQKKQEIRRQELEKLKDLKMRLELILQDLNEQKHIKNLKIFKGTCKFITPFIVTTCSFAGLGKMLGFGYPFYVDDEIIYKSETLNFQTGSSVITDESYNYHKYLGNNLISTLKVYTTWEEDNNLYSRIKRIYEFKNLSDNKIFNAIKNEDYQYILTNLNDYDEEVQYINSIESIKENNYFMDANITFINEDDFIVAKESESYNICITAFELLFSLGLSVLFERVRKYDYRGDLDSIYNIYYLLDEKISNCKYDLNKINQKILSLSNRGKKC